MRMTASEMFALFDCPPAVEAVKVESFIQYLFTLTILIIIILDREFFTLAFLLKMRLFKVGLSMFSVKRFKVYS